MLAVLLIAGIGFLLAGLLAIGFGIPVKEFSFGNTMILTGAVVACTGVMMMAIWMAVRELKRVARQLAPAIAMDPDTASETASAILNPGIEGPEDGSFRFGPDDSAAMAENAELQKQEPVEPSPSPKPRRNLLFSSSRKERERAQVRMTDSPLGDFSPGTPLTSSPEDLTEMLPAQTEDGWVRRGRSSEPPARRGSRAPSSFQPGEPAENQPPVTVLKSGVVDGMAYSLYSDGSIEAQMPEGLMRFASIDELRAHLDQRP